MKKRLLTSVFLLSLLAVKSAAARQPEVVDSVLVFPLQEQHVHGSSVVELPGGDFLLAWFQGSGERTADDVRIMGARLKKGDKKWSAPFELADTPDLPDCNPVLFMAEGKLFLVWIAVLANQWENSILRVRSTQAFGGSGAPEWQWQDNILLKPDERFVDEVAARFRELPPQHHGWSAYAPRYDELTMEATKDPGKRSIGWMTRIKPLVSGKRILLPLYSDGFNFSLLAISEDGGRSWKPSLPIVGRGPIQPALAKRADGTLVAYMRDSGDAPTRVQVSESNDGGWSWSAARKTDIPNGASVDVLVLDDGRWVMLGNDVDDGRYRLNLYFSDDEGETWPVKLPIEYDASKQGRYSYPSLIQGSDGWLHISYSYHLRGEEKAIKYVTVKP
ncbi:glycosyl hydrolase [Parapedobacter defluvii]|uniref:Glycosyl hydrolase n=1 Tax=Parapedobacter defluvii TaxID=2045106 RepID=A0ABQ1MF41_9SPHI|nr:exo-alpha-sialidase [Parapedobacter defluvii]RQP15416.1 MAG: exo-alpha-sialidase [Parapedobacter sp.]GGC37612.1 glycosyl hydrolase [Parapedobacter defluvii]